MKASTTANRRIGWLAAALLVSGACPSAAETFEMPAFAEVIDVRVVNLEVVVTRRGERLAGLGADDFRLLVDGVETPIELFTEVAGGRAGPAPEASSPARPALAPEQAVGTRYLVFVDDDFAIPSSRNWALRELAEQVGLLGAEDTMAIVAFGGHRLDLLTSWTRSPARLRAALAQGQERRVYGLLRRGEQRRPFPYGRYGPRSPAGRSFSGTGFYGLGRTLDGAVVPEELRYDDAQSKISRVVRAAAATLRAFAGTPDPRPPGRQVMLLLAGRWPAAPRWGAGALERMESDRRLLAPLIETANRLGHTLYPVDLQTGQGAAPRAEVGTRVAADLERDRLAEDALFYLAEETGGRVLSADARLTALERAVDDTRSYYWLGFTPSWRRDDAEHRVEVQTPGARARARRSFSDFSRETEVSMWIESAHLFDAPLPGAMHLGARLGRPEAAVAGRIVVPLTLEVPLEHVTLTPFEGGFASRLELRVAATDADGARADVPVVPVLITIPEPRPGGVAVYEARLKLRRKSHRLLIALFDPVTGKVLSGRLDFEP